MKLTLPLFLFFGFYSLCAQSTDSSVMTGSTTLKNSHEFNKVTQVQNNSYSFLKSVSTSKSNLIEKHRLWLNMTNTGGAFKQLLIGYIEGATNGIDRNFDGVSLDANPYIDFYSINSGSNLVIQGRALPFSENDEVQLGYRSAINGNFTISIDEGDGLLIDHAVFIEDKLTNTLHNLRATGYTFSTIPGRFNDRFVIKYINTALETDNFKNRDNKVSVWGDYENIMISSSLQNIEQLFIYEATGKLIYNDTNISASETIINAIASKNEVLIIKIILANNYIINKKIIH